MTKSNGIKSLKQAAKLLNKHAPDGESLAYINPEEGRVLRARGGSGIMTLAGVPSYGLWDTIVDYGKKALKYINPITELFGGETQQHPGSSMGTDYNDPYWQTGGYFPNYPTDVHGGNVYNKENNPFWKDVGSSIMQSGKEFLKGRYGGADAIKNIGKDALSVWTALKAKKDQEGLNNAEMEQFNKLNQQLAEYTAEFQANIAGGGVTNMPTDITEVASYTDVPLLDMKTTAVAEGGRIGYAGNGKGDVDPIAEIVALMSKQAMGTLSPDEDARLDELIKATGFMTRNKAQGGRIGYNLGGIDRPFQGIGALNPRMGYAQGMGPHWDVPTFSEGVDQMYESTPSGVKDFETINWGRESPYGAIKDLLKGTGVLDAQSKIDISNIQGGNQIQETAMAFINSGISYDSRDALKQAYMLNEYESRFPGITKIALTFINSGQAGHVEDAVQEALMIMEGSKMAHGGRIGYQEGTHPLDGVAMQMFGVTFENLNPLQQIVVTESQQKAGGMSMEERLNQPPYDATEDVEKMYKYMSAQGGRIGAQEGGIMPLLNLGGMEKDYRQDGGFVPIGRREKADDVPARLSKNEFVFTADAVRAAGGGDIDQGAQRMYNVMKNLEAGGEISEQSQGQV